MRDTASKQNRRPTLSEIFIKSAKRDPQGNVVTSEDGKMTIELENMVAVMKGMGINTVTLEKFMEDLVKKTDAAGTAPVQSHENRSY